MFSDKLRLLHLIKATACFIVFLLGRTARTGFIRRYNDYAINPMNPFIQRNGTGDCDYCGLFTETISSAVFTII